jgi:phosphoribosylformimino-5-aminoimidazole carboxamide ribonucleotide (ProFAR) isomerase
MAKKASQESLDKWTKQKWRTKSGKPSGETGERYLPEKAIKSLSSAEYAATTRAKREGTAKGKQFVKQPKSIAEKTRKFRAAEGGLAMNEGMKALKKAAPEVAKKMGYKKGGMTKKGYAKGGMVSAGASNPATQKRTPKK